jgi:hypothetical protein
VLTIQIRFDAATVTGTHVLHAGPGGEDLDAQFMSDDIGIPPKGRLAEVAGPVRPADPHAMCGHESFTRAGSGRLWDLDDPEISGGVQADRFHRRR